MKKIYLIACFVMILLFHALPSVAQQAFYIYRNDGRINTFITTEIDSIKFSQVDIDGVTHNEYVVQEVCTIDSVYRIPIELIDSVGFVTPETVYQPGVRVLEGEMRNYIISRNELTLVFRLSTPNNLLPHVGDKLVTTEVDDVITNAFVGQVSEVNPISDGIEVICTPVDLTDVFETYYGIIRKTDVSAYARRRNVVDGFYGTNGTKTFNPGKQTLDLINTHNVSISYKKDDELSYSLDNARAALSLTPVINYNAYLIVNKAYGVNVSITAVGNYTIEELFALSGNVDLNFDFPFLKKAIPIPEALIDIEFEVGFFGEAQGKFSIDQVWTQTYKHVFHWEWSSKGHESLQKLHDFKNTSNTHTGKVALNGSMALGGYGKIGVAFIATSSLDIAEIGLKYKGGVSLEGTYVPYKRDEEYSKKSTDLYNQIKDRGIAVYGFRGLTFEAELFSWSVSKEIPNFLNIPFNKRESWGAIRSVPIFSDTKLTKDENGTYYASANVLGDVQTTDVGFALINQDDENDGTYSYVVFDYKGPKTEAYASFFDKPSSRKYTLYPLVKYMGMELIAEPGANISQNDFSGCPDNHHPHIIDLGLPSGTKWSCCNVGADNPTESGNYYAWGETTPKEHYFTDNNPWYIISVDEYPRTDDEYELRALISMGAVDSKGNLVPAYDAATCSFGGSWRMPTFSEVLELKRCCDWSFETINSVDGCRFIGPNGNYIFLPFADEAICNVGHFGPNEGCHSHYTDSSIMNLNRGEYWTSTSYCNSKNQSGQSTCLSIYTGGTKQFVSPTYNQRYIGKSIRAVCKGR